MTLGLAGGVWSGGRGLVWRAGSGSGGRGGPAGRVGFWRAGVGLAGKGLDLVQGEGGSGGAWHRSTEAAQAAQVVHEVGYPRSIWCTLRTSVVTVGTQRRDDQPGTGAMSVACTGAPDRRSRPCTHACLPSVRISAPRRTFLHGH